MSHALSHPRNETLLHLLKNVALKKGNFMLASGQQTDTYLDVRQIALDSRGSFLIGNSIISYLQTYFPMCKGVGGLTLGADPIVSAALYAAHARGYGHLSGILVRKKAKDHGTMSFLEGNAPESCSILVVDDVVTSGGSMLSAAKRLREEGYQVPAAFCIVDREEGGSALLSDNGIQLHSLFTLDDVLE